MFGVFHDALDYGPLLPDAATRNPALYELLVLFDAIRGGSPRERAIALQLLDERLTS